MQKTFDEVVLFARTGLNPRQNFKLGQGNNNYITIKNIKNNSLVIDDNTDVVDDEAIRLIHKRSQIKKGDILFASIGRMGDMYIIENEPEGWDINESVFAFTLDTSIVRQKYFYYIFRVKSTLDYLASNSSGSTFKSIKMNQLKKMVFDIPSIEEQDQIVAALDRVCNVIEMRKQELVSLDDLIKARFVEMFGDPVANPKGWDMPLIEEVVVDEKNALKAGPFGSALKKEYYVSSGYKIYGQEQVISGDHTFGDYYIDEDRYKSLENCAVQAGDVLISLVGTYGKLLVMPEDFEPGIINPRLMKITFDKKRVNPYYFQYYFQSDSLKRALSENTHGGTMDILNLGIVRKLAMPLPPLELQNEFIAFVNQVDKSKVAVQKALDETQLLFDSLMQEYFG